jgi:Phage integrase, N-terminal SAM-like domain
LYGLRGPLLLQDIAALTLAHDLRDLRPAQRSAAYGPRLPGAATPPDSARNGGADPAETPLRTAHCSGCSQPGTLLERHLRAENKPDRTVDTYLEAVRLLEAFLAGRGVGLADADRAQIEAFLADLLAHWKPATAAMRSAACRAKAEQLRAKYGL